MSNINQLSGAIRFALLAGAASAFAAPAFAQDQPKELETVKVTGSNIKRSVDEETAQPVQVVSRAQIEATGLNNVAEVLSTLSSTDGSGLSTVTTQTNGSDGSQQISLRDLGAGRTLVLVDGYRWATDPSQTVDLSTIPVAIIERIEILTSGASAIYGSDAVAGVVNLITRKNYDGAQAGVYFGATSKGDGERTGFDFTIGTNGERSNSVLSASYTEQEAIFAGDREISSVPTFGDLNDTYGFPVGTTCRNLLSGASVASVGALAGSCGSASGQFGLFSGATGSGVVSRTFNNTTLDPLTGTTPVLGTAITAANFHTFRAADRYNFAPVNYLQQPAKRANLFGYTRFNFTDNLTGWARFNYTKRTSSQQLAEVPLTISAAGGNGPQWQFSIPTTNIFNPFSTAITSANYRMSLAGPRNNQFDYDIFGLQLGLEGAFELGERTFNWELMGQRNDGQYDSSGSGYINLFNLRNALGPNGFDPANGLYCGTSFATRIPGCVPFNIFGGPTGGQGYLIPNAGRTLTASEVRAAIDYISYTLVDTSGNTATNYKGTISGDLFELPGGMGGFAVGFETRKDDAFVTPDALVSEGGSSTNFAAPTRGQTTSRDFFVEFALPLLADAPLAKKLNLNIAARKTRNDAEGFADPNPSDTRIEAVFNNKAAISSTKPAVSVEWSPIEDLLVRANWGETFRAPNASELYGGVAEGFPAANDPCSTTRYFGTRTTPTPTNPTGTILTLSPADFRAQCDLRTGGASNPGVPLTVGGPALGGVPQLNAQLRGLFGSSVDLVPEEGENIGLGFVYSPNQIENLNVRLDFWQVELEDAIASLGVGDILARCHTRRNPTTGALLNQFCGNIARIADGSVAQVTAVPVNLQVLRRRGIDLGVTYSFDTDWGRFGIRWDTTYNHSIEDKADEFTTDFFDSVGLYTGNANWEYSSNVNIDWTKGDWSATWTTRYRSDVAETCFFVCNERDGDGLNHTGQYAVHDLQLGWKAPWKARIAVGARNLFGKEPPLLTNNTFAHSFDAAYDLPGGAFWYAQYRQDF
jgi:iron complex outermembrane recepter protein